MREKIQDHQRGAGWKKWAAGLALGAVVAVAGGAFLADRGKVTPDRSISSQGRGQELTTLYVGDWYSDDEYRRLGGLLAGKDVKIILSFSEPTSEALPAPRISEGLKEMVGGMAVESDVLVAVGGYGTEETRQPMLDAFADHIEDPQAFAELTSTMLHEVSDELGRPVNGVDLDFEYPTPQQAQGFSQLLQALDEKLPEAEIGIAVPAASSLGGFTGDIKSWGGSVDTARIMTYDKTTPSSAPEGAGPVASNDWTRTAVEDWRQRLSDAGSNAEVVVGLANYGYLYEGATQAGDSFTGGRTVLPEEVDSSLLVRQPDGSSAAATDEGWVSLYTAEDTKDLLAELPPDIKTFAWQAQGLQEKTLQALARR